MPLHLLGKKSWNVYNPENIAKVKRDEAQAKAREEEEERRMQEVDAERRLQLLRGQHLDALPATDEPKQAQPPRAIKRRRLAGEDDTERDMRLALEASVPISTAALAARRARPPPSDAPLVGPDGHINLFPDERARGSAAKNPEAEAEAAQKKRELEDQFTMRFSNAAGFKRGLESPWYAAKTTAEEAPEAVGKDVWGNDDRGRRERERARLGAGDPLLSMKRGVRELRTLERERRVWSQNRELELLALREAASSSGERRRVKRHRRGEEGEGDGLEGFSLDGPGADAGRERKRSKEGRGRERDGASARPAHKRHHHRHREGERGEQRLLSPEERERSRLREEKRGREELRTAVLLKQFKEDRKPGWEAGRGGRYSTQFGLGGG